MPFFSFVKITDPVNNLGEVKYDFEKSEYVWKPIINVWDEGVLPVKRVHFRNGQHIDVT
jgi:hypothetical protein